MSNNRRKRTRKRKRLSHKATKNLHLFFITGAVVLVVLYIIVILIKAVMPAAKDTVPVTVHKTDSPNIVQDLITPNEYSRPQTPLTEIKGVVVHYTANPGTDAKANRDYFNGLATANSGRAKAVYASSHYVIGLDGTIIQCVPLTEIAYASNDRNYDTVSIECCHPDKSGKFTEATYNSLVSLVAWLCGEYNITVDNIIRHYDITGKMCPKYYVKNEDAWLKFKSDVTAQF